MTLSAGTLNRRVRIERKKGGFDSSGQPLDDWDLYVEAWASVRGATGMASIRQSTPQDGVAASMNSYSFRVRFREDLDSGMRVVYAGKPFDIKQIRLDFEGREWTDIVCEVGGNDG